MKKICVVDYGVNNISSICKALKKINEDFVVISEKNNIKDFSNIILPGVGSFDTGMNVLKKNRHE